MLTSEDFENQSVQRPFPSTPHHGADLPAQKTTTKNRNRSSSSLSAKVPISEFSVLSWGALPASPIKLIV